MADASHLLSFKTVSHRAPPPPPQSRPWRKQSGGGGGNLSRGHAPLTRAQFVLANYKLIISPFASGLEEGLYNPDVLLPWEFVQCVVVDDSPSPLITHNRGAEQCPICLENARIPKMTQCGHRFCVSCLLQYLGDDTSKKCPVCAVYVRRTELRTVMYSWPQTSFNDQKKEDVDTPSFVFRLLRLPKSSIFPNFAFSTSNKPVFLPDVGDDQARYSRLVSLSIEGTRRILENEMEELLKLRTMCSMPDSTLDDYADTERLPYIDEAISLLEARMVLFEEAKAISLLEARKFFFEEATKHGNLKGGSASAIAATVPTSSAKSMNITSSEAGPVSEDKNFDYFYQDVNGSLIFLHPLCFRCLLANVGDNPLSLPEELVVHKSNIVEIENVRMSTTLRQRTHLRHIPQNCDITLIEMSMKKMVSNEIFLQFSPDFAKRAKNRKEQKQKKQRERREDQVKLEYERAQAENMRTLVLLAKEKESIAIQELQSGPALGDGGRTDKPHASVAVWGAKSMCKTALDDFPKLGSTSSSNSSSNSSNKTSNSGVWGSNNANINIKGSSNINSTSSTNSINSTNSKINSNVGRGVWGR